MWKEGSYYYAKSENGEFKTAFTSLYASLTLQAIIDASDSDTILLKNGVYYNDGIEVNVSKAGISIFGEGAGAQWICNAEPTHTCFVVSKPNFIFQNFVINSSIAKTNGAGIAIEGAVLFQNGNDRVGVNNLIRGMIIENQWEAIRIASDSRMVYLEDVDIRNPYSIGVGINNGSFIYLNKVTVYGWAHEYNYSLHILDGYSIYASECEFLNAMDYGVLSNPAATITNSWMHFINCAVETNQTANRGEGWVFTDNQGGSNVGIYLLDCWAVSSRNGIVLDGANDVKLTDCQVHGNDQYGLWIQDTDTKQIEVVGGHFDVNSRVSDNAYDGIHVDANVCYVSISGVWCLGNNIYGESGVPSQRYGIRFDAGTSTFCQVSGCTTNDNGVANISNATNIPIYNCWNGTQWLP
jgi:hypothetical protein